MEMAKAKMKEALRIRVRLRWGWIEVRGAPSTKRGKIKTHPKNGYLLICSLVLSGR
jgi:hypothetical protein